MSHSQGSFTAFSHSGQLKASHYLPSVQVAGHRPATYPCSRMPNDWHSSMKILGGQPHKFVVEFLTMLPAGGAFEHPLHHDLEDQLWVGNVKDMFRETEARFGFGTAEVTQARSLAMHCDQDSYQCRECHVESTRWLTATI